MKLKGLISRINWVEICGWLGLTFIVSALWLVDTRLGLFALGTILCFIALKRGD